MKTSNNNNHKVLFLMNIPSPYRVKFFNELSKYIDLTVVYELRKASNRESSWKFASNNQYETIFLNGLKVGHDTSLSFGILKHIFKKKFDLIVIGSYSTPTSIISILFLKFFRKKFLINTDGGYKHTNSKIKKLIKWFFIKSSIGILSPSSFINRDYVAMGYPKDKIHFYPFTSLKKENILVKPRSNQYKSILRKELNIKEDKVIISVGRVIPLKGFEDLLQSSCLLEKKYSIGIYIIGGTPYKNLQDFIRKENLSNIHFINFLQTDLLHKYMDCSDVFVLPTKSDVWGLVINEAMSRGLPIITTTKCGAGLELITDDINGYLIEDGNIKGLANSINKMLNDKELVLGMGINNLEKISDFTIENMAKTHFKIFDNLLSSKRS